MSKESTAKLVTVEEWLTYDVPEGLHAELVDGELVMNPLANWGHQQILRRLIRQIEPFTVSHPEVVATWSSPCRVPIPGKRKPRGREPDLGLYDQLPTRIQDSLAWIEVLPFLVVEVACTGDSERDYVDKRVDYWRAGISEYWIVDESRRLFLALRRTEQGWNEHLIEDVGIYTTPLLPEFTLFVEKLWD